MTIKARIRTKNAWGKISVFYLKRWNGDLLEIPRVWAYSSKCEDGRYHTELCIEYGGETFYYPVLRSRHFFEVLICAEHAYETLRDTHEELGPALRRREKLVRQGKGY